MSDERTKRAEEFVMRRMAEIDAGDKSAIVEGQIGPASEPAKALCIHGWTHPWEPCPKCPLPPEAKAGAGPILETIASPTPWKLGGCSGRMIKDAMGRDVADVDLFVNAKLIVDSVNTAARAGVGQSTHPAFSDEQVRYMVNRFLQWRLPEDFNPDAGISFKRTYNEHTAYPGKLEPVGTNLFDATQTEAMIRYLIDGMPAALNKANLAAPASEECRESAVERRRKQ